MNYYLFAVIALIAVVASASERQVFVLNPMDWTAIYPARTDLFVTTKKDLLVHPESDIPNVSLAIRRRNNEGQYEKVANFTSQEFPSFLITNGKWIGHDLFDLSVQKLVMNLFRIDENNEISDSSTIWISSYTGGYLLSDDTFVGFDWASDPYLPVTLRTHQYNSANNTWTQIIGAELTVNSQVLIRGNFANYRVYDNYMVIGILPRDAANLVVNIYERLANKSWNLVEAVPVIGITGSSGGNIFYNEVDTIAIGWSSQEDGSTMGISFFTKKNGEWTLQTFTAESIGIDFQLERAGAFLNANAFVHGSGMQNDGAHSNASIGGALIFTRKDGGDWAASIGLTGSHAVSFGAGVGINDYDILISGVQSLDSLATSFYSTPRCFFDPMNVTCHNQKYDDCTDISLNELYTINDLQCGTTAVTIDGVGFNQNGGQARFSFTRGFDTSAVRCNATIACPNNHMEVPVEPFMQVPVVQVPVAEVPVAKSVTSSSNPLQLGLFTLLVFISF